MIIGTGEVVSRGRDFCQCRVSLSSELLSLSSELPARANSGLLSRRALHLTVAGCLYKRRVNVTTDVALAGLTPYQVVANPAGSKDASQRFRSSTADTATSGFDCEAPCRGVSNRLGAALVGPPTEWRLIPGR